MKSDTNIQKNIKKQDKMSNLTIGQWRCHPDHPKFAVKISEESSTSKLTKCTGWDARGKFYETQSFWLQRTFLVADPEKLEALEQRLQDQLTNKI